MSASAPLTPRQIFQTLDAVSRRRALTDSESRQLERAIRAMDAAKGTKEPEWSAAESKALKEMIAKGCRVKAIAPAFGRTPTALYRHACRFGGVKAVRRQGEAR